VGKKGTIIELNGKRYNALTGELLSNVSTTNVAAKPRAYGAGHQSAPSGKFVDGFIKPAHVATKAQSTPKTPVHVAAAAQPTVKPSMDIHRPAGVKIAHHAPKKSQTLMRSAVAKPEPSVRRKTKVTSHTHALVAQPEIKIVKKLAHPKVDPRRAQRSALVSQSELIHRFSNTELSVPKPALPAPAAVKPVYASTPVAHAVATPLAGASSMDVFERALQRANSHLELPVDNRQKRVKRRKSGVSKRVFGASVSALAVVLLAGFIAFQNQANLTIHYASNKAGFAANLPAYKPAGYSVGKFTYSPGQVGVTYANNASGQSFSMVQKQSSWDSQALRDDYVATQSQSYKTIESAGRTIYTYGNNSATWVNGGVWYQVDTAGSLTTEEIVNLATSM
jgi:hypothetical protein